MRKHGFTLVELLVVIAIIGILIALLLPAVQAAREAARRMECTNKIKQLALASQNYHDIHQFFPGGAVYLYGNSGDGAMTNFSFFWAISLMPFMEQSALYDEFNNNVSLNNDSNPKLSGGRTNCTLGTEVIPNWLYCPSDAGAGRLITKTYVTDRKPGGCRTMSYKAVGGHGHTAGVTWASYSMLKSYRSDFMAYRGVFHGVGDAFSRDVNGTMRTIKPFFESMATILDGTSNTVCFVDASTSTDVEETNVCPHNNYFCFMAHNMIYTSRPHPITFMTQLSYSEFEALRGTELYDVRQCSAGSYHKGGINAAKVDGSVAFISNTIDLTIWQYFVRIEDGMANTN